MFTISLVTDTVIPENVVVLRTAADGWADRAGDYTCGAWQFVLDERDYAGGLEFKFVILPGRSGWLVDGRRRRQRAAARGRLAPVSHPRRQPARRLLIGQFQKHVWSLWQSFQVIN
jgi:hypothetical protein